jgi:peptidoglycan hydrolase-like protein with peptidoglycan-binding domain
LNKQKFIHRSLYRSAPKVRIPKRIPTILLIIFCIAPICSEGADESYEQDFLITAYYSPIPDQCCYVKGGLKADKILNGNGTHAADGTPVYPGMVAAPAGYNFGTSINLPGIGVFKVHDRGGAIIERGDGLHRLDLWVGYGEEGLARALALGIVRVKGTVYPEGSVQPETSFELESLDAPLKRLDEFKLSGTNLLDTAPALNERSYSAMMMQEHLKSLGYFTHASTGFFGEVTQESIRRFQQDFRLSGRDDKLTEQTAAYILSAVRRKDASNPIDDNVDSSSARNTIQQAQRLLRFLGFYEGRTDGEYSDELMASILKFQQEYWLVGTKNDPGAGRIGPITMRHIRALWDRTLVSRYAEKLIFIQKVKSSLTGEQFVDTFLQEGQYGTQVKNLQSELASLGYFPHEKINGSFGPLTKDSVVSYQIDYGIISSKNHIGAGVVGPATLSSLRSNKLKDIYARVRSEGLKVL